MPKWLLFIEANTTGTGLLALQQAATLGVTPILFTNRRARYPGLEQSAWQVIECDTNSLPALKQTIEATLPVAQIGGITTTSEFYVETVAELTAAYGLSGNPVTAMRTCRNKALTRLALASAGVLQPRFTIVCHEDEIQPAIESIGLPCVVKPADDTGSNLVRLCRTEYEVLEQSRHILALRTNVRGQPTALTVLVEEFLDAPEYSVEMFSWQGSSVCVGITEKHLLGLPHFVEHRHIFPARLPTAVVASIADTVRRALNVAGVTTGATHTEIKLTIAGCAIVEINARLAGGMIPELVRHATGIDLLEQQLRAALGQPPVLIPTVRDAAGIQFIVAVTGGTLVTIEGIEAARAIPGVVQVTTSARPGMTIVPPRSAYDRLGYIIVHGSTYADTVARLDQATTRIDLLLSHERVI